MPTAKRNDATVKMLTESVDLITSYIILSDRFTKLY